VEVRATSHDHYQYCKQGRCHNRWGPVTGWTRVSRGSHAGHIPLDGARPRIPGRDMHERTSTSDALRLIPLESIDPRRYVRRPPGIELPWHHDDGPTPPWYKRVYRHPEDNKT